MEHTLVSVVTAGDVGAIQPRLGVSSFDVTASVSTPDELIVELETAAVPDVIIVESSLFPTVEPIVERAPDALIIAIGDETPVGAVGHVPPGMTGGAIASLVHALLAGGVTAAVAAVAVFEPGAGPPPSAPAAGAGRIGRTTSRATIVTSGAVAASLVAALAWGVTRGRPETPAVAAPARPTGAPAAPGPTGSAVIPDVIDQPGVRDPRQGRSADRAGAPSGPATGPSAHDAGLGPEGPQSGGPQSDGPQSGGPQSDGPQSDGPQGEGPPDRTPSPDDDREPRGKHKGWEHKPPKHDDEGKHNGWR
jgi:hypothetical protein